MEGLKNASYKTKEDYSLPKGAKIIKNTTSLNVEEIENGYLITKSSDISYKVGDKQDYCYHTKKFFSKENPLESYMENFKEKSLADNFK